MSHQGKDLAATDAAWIVPGLALTVASGLFAIIAMPDRSGVLPALLLLPYWLIAAGAAAALWVLAETVRMMGAGVDQPIGVWLKRARQNRRLLSVVAFGMLLAGLNMITFMWIKALLNYMIPFWADPHLARLDHALFGTDPWRLFTFLNVTPLAIFYHRGWFALMIIMLLQVLAARPSREKTAVLLTYFLLWSVFGPAVHAILPAAGPVFFHQLGYGDAFLPLVMEPETQRAADYLWSFYVKGGFGAGAGISAMPSLHIATTVWMVIASYSFAPKLLWPVTAAAILIFLLSISLGWHYAIDGIVGAAGAWAICWSCRFALLFRKTENAIEGGERGIQPERSGTY